MKTINNGGAWKIILIVLMGLVAATKAMPVSDDRKMIISLEYNDDSSWDDDNDGIDNMTGVVDLSVKNSYIDSSLKKEKLCTMWSVMPEESGTINLICFGSEDCCALLELRSSEENWDEALCLHYNRYGAARQNKVKAQIFYADFGIQADFQQSSALELPVLFIDPAEPKNLDITFAKQIPAETGSDSTVKFVITNFGKEAIQNLFVSLEGDVDFTTRYFNVAEIPAGGNAVIEVEGTINDCPAELVVYLNNNLFKEETL
ncbi:hypothetical protein JXA85_06670 [Candidatus Woesearchaeota archaeon]|nr:hypothetical protein [Candidatus Woesearchaeota archaeon]